MPVGTTNYPTGWYTMGWTAIRKHISMVVDRLYNPLHPLSDKRKIFKIHNYRIIPCMDFYLNHPWSIHSRKLLGMETTYHRIPKFVYSNVCLCIRQTLCNWNRFKILV